MENFIPEYSIYKFVNAGIKHIQDDYEKAKSKESSFLYRAFNGIKIGNFDYYEQAKSIVVDKSEQSKELSVFIGKNIQRNPVPSIHIILPNENEGEINSMGFGHGNLDDFINEDNETFTDYNRVYSRSFECTYNLLIVGNSINECNLIYRLLQYIFIAYNQEMSAEGFVNLRMSGQDIDLEGGGFPEKLYSRGLALTFNYEISVPSFASNMYFKNTEYDIKNEQC